MTDLVVPILLLIAGVILFAGVGLAIFARRTNRRVEAEVPPLGTFVSIRGARIHLVDEGEGPSLVLIHGLGGQMRNLTHPLLRPLSKDFRVVAIDRPGSGYSTRAPGVPAGIDTDAEVVAGVIEHLGLTRPVLVGHSLGGAVALATAVRHPDRVGGLALVAPLTRAVDSPPEVFRSLSIHSGTLRRLVGWTLAPPVALRLQNALLREIFRPEPVPADFRTAGGGALSARPSTLIAAAADLLAVPGRLPAIEHSYGSIEVPVGILYGRGDRVLHPGVQGEGMRERVPDLTVEMIEGGHMIPYTRPGATERFVRGVMERVRNGQPPACQVTNP